MLIRYKSRPPVLLDTNILTPILRHERNRKVSAEVVATIRKEIKLIGEAQILICPIVVGELYRKMSNSERRSTKETLREYRNYPLNKEISAMFEHLMYSYREHSPAVADTLIGATAIVANAEIWTNNQRHFRYFDEVRLYRPALRYKFD